MYDKDRPPSLKDAPPPYVVANLDWSGFYVGATLGGGWGTSKAFVSNNGNQHGWANNDPSGVVAGGTVGYNFQLTPAWVIGAEADLSWMNLDGEQGLPVFDGHYWTGGWDGLATVRARFGYAMGPTLIYGTGGFASLHTNETISGNNADESTYGAGWRSGWTVGGGVEHKFTDRLSAKVEYLHAGFEDLSGMTGFPSNTGNQYYTMESDLDLVRVGLNYKMY